MTSLHVTGPRRRRRRGQPGPPGARRRPGEPSAAAGPAGPAPRRRSRPVSTSGSRSPPGSVAVRPTPRRRSTAPWRRGAPSSTEHARLVVAAARVGRSVLPRRRAGARRGPWRARRAARRPARRARRPARHPAGRGLDAGRVRGVRRDPRTTATAPFGPSSAHLAEELRAGLSAADLVARAGVLAVGQRPAAGRGRSSCRSSSRSGGR